MPFFCVAGVTQLEEGAVTLGMVTSSDAQRGLLVQLPFGGVGTVAVTDLADAYRPNPLDRYKKHQIVRSASWRRVVICLHDLSVAIIVVYFQNLFSASGVSFFGKKVANGSCPCVHQGVREFNYMWPLVSSIQRFTRPTTLVLTNILLV